VTHQGNQRDRRRKERRGVHAPSVCLLLLLFLSGWCVWCEEHIVPTFR